MVIFGAGASCDSSPSEPLENVGGLRWRPPLADELFDMRRFGHVINHFTRAKEVFTHLLPKIGERVDVERVLEKLQNKAKSGDKERDRQLAAVQFYLQAMITQCTWNWKATTNDVTNYGTLIGEVRDLKQPACLVTFNYDTLLDEAVARDPLSHVKFTAMSDYVASDYKVIKFHGSVNWVHEVMARVDNLRGRNQLAIATEVIDRRPDLVINPEYEIVFPTRDDIDSGFPIAKSGDKAVIPALAVPVEHKPGDEIPSEHRKVFDECLPQITKILVIGWRANETRFLEILAQGLVKGKTAPKVMIVSRDEPSASETGNKIRQKLRQGGVLIGDSFKVSKGGFTGAVRNGETEAFIHS